MKGPPRQQPARPAACVREHWQGGPLWSLPLHGGRRREGKAATGVPKWCVGYSASGFGAPYLLLL